MQNAGDWGNNTVGKAFASNMGLIPSIPYDLQAPFELQIPGVAQKP